MSKLKLFKSQEPHHIMGSTLINHGPRIKLGITCNEYCLVTMILYCKKKDKPFDEDRVYRHLGYSWEQVQIILTNLKEKDIIRITEGKFTITKKWKAYHNVHKRDEFDDFVKPYLGIQWPGSMPEARQKYDMACEKVGPAHLLERKHAYFEFLKKPENSYRKVMQATVFLNPNKERYNENWEGNIDSSNKLKESIPVKERNKSELDKLSD